MPADSRYELLEEVGRGGFATVYKARDTRLNREVALKVLHEGWSDDPDFVRRFQQEAETAANFNHPNIVGVYDVGELGRRPFIAMEYVPGADLESWLARQDGPLTTAAALPILEQIAAALDYAHERRVVHRDVTPGNILVRETAVGPQVKLTDFGLVKALEGNRVITTVNQTLGTPEYMAPEQADPNRRADVGAHTDRYALGIVAYRMLAGRVPFPGGTISTLNAHANLDVPSPREFNPAVPAPVEAVLRRMLAKAPADRYATAAAFVAALRAAAA
ncbi:MAG: serine/threonine protein kinase, partial [Anaerolineales bacterium]|nr:serine/threonine protein kinase [Anaerolineales bacterium]